MNPSVARIMMIGATQIETLLLIDQIDRDTICKLPIIGDALTSKEIDELAGNRDALAELAMVIRAVAEASLDPA